VPSCESTIDSTFSSNALARQMPKRRFPAPWRPDKMPGRYVVRADIAVLGAPDDQAFYEGWATYNVFTVSASALSISDAPDFAAASRSCSRSKEPTLGMSLSITNLGSAMAFSRLQLRTSGINATASPEAATWTAYRG
jgi:hypothetical protein